MRAINHRRKVRADADFAMAEGLRAFKECGPTLDSGFISTKIADAKEQQKAPDVKYEFCVEHHVLYMHVVVDGIIQTHLPAEADVEYAVLKLPVEVTETTRSELQTLRDNMMQTLSEYEICDSYAFFDPPTSLPLSDLEKAFVFLKKFNKIQTRHKLEDENNDNLSVALLRLLADVRTLAKHNYTLQQTNKGEVASLQHQSEDAAPDEMN